MQTYNKMHANVGKPAGREFRQRGMNLTAHCPGLTRDKGLEVYKKLLSDNELLVSKYAFGFNGVPYWTVIYKSLVPFHLMLPNAPLLMTFKNPALSIASMVRSWGHSYAESADVWIRTSELQLYFKNNGFKVFFIRTDDPNFGRFEESILNFVSPYKVDVSHFDLKKVKTTANLNHLREQLPSDTFARIVFYYKALNDAWSAQFA